MAKKAINHAARKHALLSASGSSRWLNCTPSAVLEEGFPDEPDSAYAKEGTLAHEFGDVTLRAFIGDLVQPTLDVVLGKLRKYLLYTDEMEGQVEKYTDYVLECFAEANERSDGNAELLVEQRLDFSHWVPKGFGTGDATIIADGVMEIIDLKYGKGVKVDAPGNTQMRLYGLGALREWELSYDIHTVRMTIVQPRLDHISTEELSVEELLEWGDTVVKPKAELAINGEGETVAGDWCKWCKVKPKCRAYHDRNLELAKMEFKDPQLLTDEEIALVHERQAEIADWVNVVNKYMLDQALAGREWPGFKLVEGRSSRKWKDEKQAEEALRELGFTEADFRRAKLQGITAIEKLLGKKEFQEKLGDKVDKPVGKPTLAPESDKRPPFGISQAKAAFKD